MRIGLCGTMSVGKTTLVNYMMNNYLLVCKINIKNKLFKQNENTKRIIRI